MDITPFTIAMPDAEVDDLLAPRAEHPLAVGCRRPTGAAACRPTYARKLADYWADALRLAGPGGRG